MAELTRVCLHRFVAMVDTQSFAKAMFAVCGVGPEMFELVEVNSPQISRIGYPRKIARW